MTAIDFPNSPSVNDTFTVGERTWKWTGSVWDVVVTTQITGPTGATGATGPAGPGIAIDGTTGQALVKASNDDFDTEWIDFPAQAYSHGQVSTSTLWTITHNLGYNPAVTVKDNYGNLIEGYVSYTSNSSLTIEFSSAISGYAYLS